MPFVQLPALHTECVSSLTFYGDGPALCSTSLDASVALWDIRALTNTAMLRGHTDAVNCCVAFSDGLRIATAGEDNVALVWDVRSTAHPVLRLGGVGTGVNRLALGTYDSLLYSAADDGCVVIHDPCSGGVIDKFMAADAAVNDLCVIRSTCDYIVTGAEDNSVRVWLGGLPSAIEERVPHSADARTVDDNDDGTADAVRSHVPNPGRLVDSVDEFQMAVNHVIFDACSAGGELLVACSNCVFALQLDLTAAEVISRSDAPVIFQGHDDYVRGICTVPIEGAGSHRVMDMYTVSDDRTIAVWRLGVPHPSTVPTNRFVAHDGMVMSAACDARGKFLATGDDQAVIRLWNIPLSDSMAQ